jgi:hypothetical protein
VNGESDKTLGSLIDLFETRSFAILFVRGLVIAGEKQERFVAALMKIVRRLERVSRPRLMSVFGHRLSNVVFGGSCSRTSPSWSPGAWSASRA